ncbi:hypothetical protein Amsp01_077000 [Amycolatopsis sp. NBRC 101858]|nr:hypothetical protein Amsp01_077000 [Amycolatopsis sp. NBRC 101858]
MKLRVGVPGRAFATVEFGDIVGAASGISWSAQLRQRNQRRCGQAKQPEPLKPGERPPIDPDAT